RSQFRDLADEIGADDRDTFGVVAVLAHIFYVALNLLFHVAIEVFQFGRAFKVAGIHNSNLHEHKVLKYSRKYPHDAEKGVQPEAIEAIREDDGSFSTRIVLGLRLGRSVW